MWDPILRGETQKLRDDRDAPSADDAVGADHDDSEVEGDHAERESAGEDDDTAEE